MPRVALVHSQSEFSTALSTAVNASNSEWVADDLSELSRLERARQLFSGDYDLFQADETLGNGVLAAVAGAVTRTPFVVCLRGWGDMMNAHGQYGPIRTRSIRARSRAVLSAAARTMTLGTQTRTELWDAYGRLLSHTEAVPRPLDIDAFQVTSGATTDGGLPTELVTVTNLRYQAKLDGVTLLLEALSDVLPQHPEATYRIAGDGRHLSSIKEAVDDHPCTDQIEVLGYIDDVPALLADADVFAYASFLDAYPTAVLEAQAAGLPVVAASASGVPDAVGDAGLVCESRPQELSSALDEVLSDSSTRSNLAMRSRQRMADYNSVAASRYQRVWESALDADSIKGVRG